MGVGIGDPYGASTKGGTIQYLPTSGDTSGGNEVNITGPSVFDMTSVEGNFGNGAIDTGFWDIIDTVDGLSTASIGRVEFKAPIGNSIAGIKTKTLETNFDVETQWTVIQSAAIGTETVWVANLRIESYAGSVVQAIDMRIEDRGPGASVRPNSRVLVITKSSAAASLSREWIIGAPGRINTVYRLRILQYENRIWFFLNEELWHYQIWVGGSSRISLLTQGGLLHSSCTSTVDLYARRPLVVFGDEPSLTVTKASNAHVMCSPPEVQNPTEVTPKVITTYGSEYPMTPNYTYTRSSMLSWGISTDKVLTLTNDPVLRGVEVA